MKHNLVALLAFFLAAPAMANVPGRVFFIEPAAGAKVPPKFKVKMGVEGMTVSPAGVLQEGAGHHHLLIDRPEIAKNTVVPTSDTAIHFGKGQTETEITLKPGPHKLTLQFANGMHQSYGPEWSATINVEVQAQAQK